MKFNKLDVPHQWKDYFTKYPHGYTIFEALCSWTKQVDNMVDNQNNWNDYLDNFVEHFEFELQEEVKGTLTKWQNEGILDDIINNALNTRLDTFEDETHAKFEMFGTQLTDIATDIATELDDVKGTKTEVINVKNFGAVGDYDEDLKTGTDNTIAFQNAFSYGAENNLPVYVPNGNFLVNGRLELYDSLIGEGTIIFTSDDDARIYIGVKKPKLQHINLDVSNISGLEKGSNKIDGLPSDCVGDILVINSDEKLIDRNYETDYYYTKNEVVVVRSETGLITPQLDDSYNTSQITSLYIEKRQDRLYFNVNIKLMDDENKSKPLILCERSNVEFNGVEMTSIGTGRFDTGIRCNNVAYIDFINCKITKAKMDGQGYGVNLFKTCFVNFKNCHMYECRHPITGRHSKYTHIDGGSFHGNVDNHWGSNFIVENATLYGTTSYAGKDIIIRNNHCYCGDALLRVRTDTLELDGDVIIENNKVETYLMNGWTHIITLATSPVDFTTRTLKLPNRIFIKNNIIDLPISEDVRMVRLRNAYGDSQKYIMPNEITIDNNTIVNDNLTTIDLMYSKHVKDNTHTCKLNIKNQIFSGTGYSNRNLIIVDVGKSLISDFKFDIFIENCENLSVGVDEDVFNKMVIRNCKSNYISRFEDYSRDIDLTGRYGVLVEGGSFDNVTFNFKQIPCRFSNIQFRGHSNLTLNADIIEYIVACFGEPGATGISSFNLFNYRKE